MASDSYPRFVEKLIALLLVVTWLLITTLLTLGAIDTQIPPYWLAFTGLVFLLVGRLWDIEVAGLLPGTGGSDSNSGGGDD